MLSSLAAYSHFVYSLLADHPAIQRHTIRIYPRGSLVGVVEGTIEFDQEVTLSHSCAWSSLYAAQPPFPGKRN